MNKSLKAVEIQFFAQPEFDRPYLSTSVNTVLEWSIQYWLDNTQYDADMLNRKGVIFASWSLKLR